MFCPIIIRLLQTAFTGKKSVRAPFGAATLFTELKHVKHGIFGLFFGEGPSRWGGSLSFGREEQHTSRRQNQAVYR